MPTPLPEPLGQIETPKFLSPSRACGQLRCPLSVVGEGAAGANLLPTQPKAILGTLLHHVRAELAAGRWAGATSATEALKPLLEAVLASVDTQLEQSPATRAYVPLRRTIGRLEWDDRMHRLRRWVEDMGDLSPSSEAPRSLSLSFIGNSEQGAGREPILEEGEEAMVVAPKLGVRGRVDYMKVPRRGPIEIVDFKSGGLTDEAGELKADVTLQLRLYALAVEELTNGRSVKLELAGLERHSVPWGASQREKTKALVEALFAETPRDGSANATDIARPGESCRTCRVRPVCLPYLEKAPMLWKGATGYRLPLDMWGRLEAQENDGVGHKARLRDPSDRLMIISGLDPQRGLQDLGPGTHVYFFDLEATRDRWTHGCHSHPRNFHEFPADGGRRRRRAVGLQVYYQSKDV